MCIDSYGHHYGGSSFVYINDFCYYKIVCIPTGTSLALRKKKQVKSPSPVSRASRRDKDCWIFIQYMGLHISLIMH